MLKKKLIDTKKIEKKPKFEENSTGTTPLVDNLISLKDIIDCKNEFKESSNEKEWNFKIASWNINGLRAWIKKGGINYLEAEDPDIFCLQETKYDHSKIHELSTLSNYRCHWLASVRKGYAGVGIMSKTEPIRVEYGISDQEFDKEGRVMMAEYEKFYLINSYVPNAGAKLVRLNYRLKWSEVLRDYLNKLDQVKPVIWTGDLNVAHNRIDLKYPNSHLHSACFTIEERNSFSEILSDGYFDSFRYLYPSRSDAYTFYTHRKPTSRHTNSGWRLDYFVMSNKLKKNLVDHVIRPLITGSDHVPIVLYLNFE
ncbi:DNA-(apurinic or apyrimidinic site) lyase-like [Brachionus plicatilis]|uniref:exodeoxyribonuclease III n=1 Tax=Brachionus plicatilis TaxID=10195 RepID=A0A3M7RFR2_BRAPC|nr:DNA-(apurinic or apyrimidinic site) lyase-like [Brachionus plicatilis]